MTLLTLKYEQAERLEIELEELKNAIQLESSRLRKTVSSEKQKHNTILTNSDGRSIQVDHLVETTSGMVHRVFEWNYDDKQGDLIKEFTGFSLNRIVVLFADGRL